MIISHKHKFVFLQTTKTGSSSIYVTLKEKYKTVNPENHLNAVQAKRFFDEKKYNWDEYFKFAFVRNPWDRYVSAYYYRKQALDKIINKN